jgi:hypothetical protein
MDIIINKLNNLELNHLDNIIHDNKIYDYKVENNILENFKKITLKEHSYPIKKNKWINFIKCHKKKLKVSIKYDPENILLNIIYDYPIYKFEESMYKNIIHLLNDYKIKLNIYNYKNVIEYIKHYSVLNIEVNNEDILNILVKHNYLKIIDNKYILQKLNDTLKRKKINDIIENENKNEIKNEIKNENENENKNENKKIKTI